LSSIVYGLSKLKLKEALIITNEEEKVIEKDGFKIIIMPLWKWLITY